jgi:carboxyl-terminal processing protease
MSYILPTGKTVISYKYKNSPTAYNKTGPDQLPEDEGGTLGDHVINLPIVVICDEYTASAGEIFVSCLRDYEAEGVLDDVVIVGKNTYGKGIMQGSVNYEVDNSYVTLTIAYYNPPSDVNYHGIGIAPDVEVDLGETEDTQLKEAIEQMNLLLQSK